MRYSADLESIMRLRNLQSFPLCIECDEKAAAILHRVYPLMQKYILKLLDSKCLSDVTLVLFGSALTMLCNNESDLDIAVKTESYDLDKFHQTRNIIEDLIDIPCDVVYYNDITESDHLLPEIKKGLILRRD